MSLAIRKVYMCLICDKRFATQIHLIKHERLVHNIVKQYSECTRVERIHKCLDCGASFQFTNDLRDHLHREHNIRNVIEELTFLSYNDFLIWLATEEKKHTVRYLKQNRIIRKGYTEISYFNCFQSGSDRSVLMNRRRDKRKYGNCYCTSQIIAKKDAETGECSIQYFKTHYGHETSRNFLRLITVDQKKIASQLIQGISPERILDNIWKQTRPSFKSNLALPQNITNIQTVIPPAENDNKSQLIMEIQTVLSQIKENVNSGHHNVETLCTVLKDLEAVTALVNSNTETNHYKPVTQITIQPAEEGTEGHQLLVKKKFITINKANLKPYTEDVKDSSIMDTVVSGEPSFENNSKDRFILL